MASEKKVIYILMIILALIYPFNSRRIEPKKFSNLEMLYEDPLVFETLEFTREFYRQSEYIENNKEICNFLSANWKYEEHQIFIEYIFATKNYVTRNIKLFKIIISHDETKFKSYKHDIKGAWNIILFEKMKPDKLLLMKDERIEEIKQIIENYIKRGEKYIIEKINDIVFFEKVNQIKENNEYICSVSLSLKGGSNNDIIKDEFLIEEDISSDKKSFRYVIYRNPNI